jgi:Ca2+-binding RTX toxin-like protein
VVGSKYDDVLTGYNQMNLISGGNGNDTIKARGSSEYLSGDAGDDLVDCGAGRDVISYFDSPFGVVVNLGTGKAAGWGTDTLRHVEDADGSEHPDSPARHRGREQARRRRGCRPPDRPGEQRRPGR